MQIALPGSLHRVIVSLCSSVHSLTAIQHSRGTRCRSPCRARCIVSSCRCVAACTHSQLSTTVEAHDADRPAGLAASCHRVAVYSFTAVHRGTRCRSPCRARCIVSWCDRTLTHRVTAIHQSRHTMQIALPGSLHRVAGCSVPAVSHVRAICTCVRVPCLWCSDLVGCQ
jgi:hypothetical protein